MQHIEQHFSGSDAVRSVVIGMADVADAMHGKSKALRQAVQEHKQANPLDPRLEEWKDFLEAWAEEMPKEPEE
jgi:hypothetical protein